MKKSTVAISVIAALAAITTGGAWYTGNQIEQRYPELLEQVNIGLKSLQAYDIHAEIGDVKLTKGFFSSAVQYNVKIKTDDNSFTLNGNDTMYHGPLPLNRLMKGNLMPMLLSGETLITTLDSELKRHFAGNEVLSATTDVHYSGNVAGNVTLNPFKSDEIETSKIYFEGDYNGFGKQNLTADLLKITDKNENKGAIELTGLRYDANYIQDKQYPELKGLGDYQASVKKFTFVNEKNEILNLHELVSKGSGKIENDRMLNSGDLTVKMDWAANTKTADLGKVQFDMWMDIDANSFNELTLLSDKFESESPEIQSRIQTAVMNLISRSPKLKISELSIENAKGKNTFSLNLDLNKFDIAQVSQAKSIEDTLKIFKPSHLDLNVNLAASEEWAKQWLTIAPDANYVGTPEENAKLRIQELTNSAKYSGIATVDAENIKLALKIENGKVNLNGREVSESELQLALWAIMLGASGLGH
ncbi:YdgA family protein [Actinobacillus equuli subsp. haemolyticus]|uniref:YdgA family protein n=1 Tax=Actinobacillus equuli TaxID=718 RepID=UPI0024425DDB|nr:YdgA family protein [Actinobacillus equuli]WGE67975.1 YdgA family protein [Actinobacillus equuli subsp. haemolyticus]